MSGIDANSELQQNFKIRKLREKGFEVVFFG